LVASECFIDFVTLHFVHPFGFSIRLTATNTCRKDTRSLNTTVLARSRSPHELAPRERAHTHKFLLAYSRALCLSPACKEKPASNYCANLKDTCGHKDNKVYTQTRGRASLRRTREASWTILYRGAQCAFRMLSVYDRTAYVCVCAHV
jgi:hypothetical protein